VGSAFLGFNAGPVCVLLSNICGLRDFRMVGLSKSKRKIQPVTCHEGTEAE
jgi:hypothetical protein